MSKIKFRRRKVDKRSICGGLHEDQKTAASSCMSWIYGDRCLNGNSSCEEVTAVKLIMALILLN